MCPLNFALWASHIHDFLALQPTRLVNSFSRHHELLLQQHTFPDLNWPFIKFHDAAVPKHSPFIWRALIFNMSNLTIKEGSCLFWMFCLFIMLRSSKSWHPTTLLVPLKISPWWIGACQDGFVMFRPRWCKSYYMSNSFFLENSIISKLKMLGKLGCPHG